MTLSEAMATQPAWVQIWLNILLLAAACLRRILGTFDHTDVIRYALGERTPLALPPAD